MPTPNVQRVNLEKAFKTSATTGVQRNICLYLKLLRDKSYAKLLEGSEDAAPIIGELRILQKLLNVLELGSEPNDLSLNTQV